MDSFISRQAAIDAVKKNTFRLTFAEEQNCEGHVAWSAYAVYSEVMEGALLELPSVQPEPSQVARDIATIIENEQDMRVMLSQPEIVRCKDCKHWINDHLCESLSRFGSFETKADFYCGYSERRTDDANDIT